MKKLLLKVCGLTIPANIQATSKLSVDLLGFIFYPPSPRFVGGKMTAVELAKLAIHQKKVGVFVNETKAKMEVLALEYGLDALQLHGQESPDLCFDLQGHRSIIKAFPIAEPADFEPTKHYEGACDYFLFDTKGSRHGGNGVAFDWDILAAYDGETPFLSGGIAPVDALKIKQINHPQLVGLDLNSRFESSPGVKNQHLLQPFIQQFAD